jgi:hypothetical protein
MHIEAWMRQSTHYLTDSQQHHLARNQDYKPLPSLPKIMGPSWMVDETWRSGSWFSRQRSLRCLRKCVICRRLRTPPTEQKMSQLPPDQMNPSPPFTYCGMDFFRPYQIIEGRHISNLIGFHPDRDHWQQRQDCAHSRVS